MRQIAFKAKILTSCVSSMRVIENILDLDSIPMKIVSGLCRLSSDLSLLRLIHQLLLHTRILNNGIRLL